MDKHAGAIQFLTTLPCFRGAGAAAVRGVASRCRRVSLAPAQSVFTEGDPCRHLYILVTGRVKCYRANPEGREQILKIFEHPGDMFCTTSAFSTGVHIVTGETLTDVTLYVIDIETMKRVALEQPAVALALVTAAGDQMQSLVGLADDLSLKTATARIAKLLYERARVEGGRDGEEIRLRRDGLREEQIAAVVGAVRVHVSRSLKALANMGAISLERDVIRIRDPKALVTFLDATESGDTAGWPRGQAPLAKPSRRQGRATEGRQPDPGVP
jgi:CRP-like cAMP-binding protein